MAEEQRFPGQGRRYRLIVLRRGKGGVVLSPALLIRIEAINRRLDYGKRPQMAFEGVEGGGIVRLAWLNPPDVGFRMLLQDFRQIVERNVLLVIIRKSRQMRPSANLPARAKPRTARRSAVPAFNLPP